MGTGTNNTSGNKNISQEQRERFERLEELRKQREAERDGK